MSSLSDTFSSERWYSVRLFQLFQCFVIFSALLRWWRQWWWWGKASWSHMESWFADCFWLFWLFHNVPFVSCVLWFAWHVLDISLPPVGVACGQAGLAICHDLPMSVSLWPSTRGPGFGRHATSSCRPAMKSAVEWRRESSQPEQCDYLMDLDGFIMFYPEFAQTLTLTAEAESDDNPFQYLNPLHLSLERSGQSSELARSSSHAGEEHCRLGLHMFAHVCTVCSFCIWFDVCAIVHSCTEMLDEDLSPADLKGFCKRSKMRYILSFQNHDWNREQSKMRYILSFQNHDWNREQQWTI